MERRGGGLRCYLCEIRCSSAMTTTHWGSLHARIALYFIRTPSSPTECDLLPVPRSAAAMDKILEAVVMSSYPASVKQGLVRRVLEAARQPLDREQCLALLALGARLYVDGADELSRRVGCQLLHVAGRRHPEVFGEFFSARRVLRLLQGGAGPPGPRALACVQLGLQLLPEGPAAEEVFALLRREVLRTVCERPGPAACAQVARLLARHPRCLPDGPHRLLLCQQLVRCLGRFRCPAEGEEGAVEFLEQAQQVSGLLAQLWRAQPAAILPCLKELFAVISGTGGCARPGRLGVGKEGARVCAKVPGVRPFVHFLLLGVPMCGAVCVCHGRMHRWGSDVPVWS